MPWLVNMSRLDRFNIISSYDRWAEEVQALLSLSNVQKAITEKGTQGDDVARGIIMLSLDRDLRDYMSGKVAAGTAADLWNGIKKAKHKLVSLLLPDTTTPSSSSSSSRTSLLELLRRRSRLVRTPSDSQTDITPSPSWTLPHPVTTGGRRESFQSKVTSR